MRKRSTKSWSCNPAWSALLVRARRKMRFAFAAGVGMVETIHTTSTLKERAVFLDEIGVVMLRRDLTRSKLGTRLFSTW